MYGQLVHCIIFAILFNTASPKPVDSTGQKIYDKVGRSFCATTQNKKVVWALQNNVPNSLTFFLSHAPLLIYYACLHISNCPSKDDCRVLWLDQSCFGTNVIIYFIQITIINSQNTNLTISWPWLLSLKFTCQYEENPTHGPD